MQYLIEAINDAGVSVNELATKTGIPRTTLNRTLAGHRPATLDELARIAKALGRQPADLLPDDFKAGA